MELGDSITTVEVVVHEMVGQMVVLMEGHLFPLEEVQRVRPLQELHLFSKVGK